jgi:hypothetical protein
MAVDNQPSHLLLICNKNLRGDSTSMDILIGVIR